MRLASAKRMQLQRGDRAGTVGKKKQLTVSVSWEVKANLAKPMRTFNFTVNNNQHNKMPALLVKRCRATKNTHTHTHNKALSSGEQMWSLEGIFSGCKKCWWWSVTWQPIKSTQHHSCSVWVPVCSRKIKITTWRTEIRLLHKKPSTEKVAAVSKTRLEETKRQIKTGSRA